MFYSNLLMREFMISLINLSIITLSNLFFNNIILEIIFKKLKDVCHILIYLNFVNAINLNLNVVKLRRIF